MQQKGKINPNKAYPIIIRVKLFGKSNRVEGPTMNSDKPVTEQPIIKTNLFSILAGTNYTEKAPIV
jgi:hypothetical protein